MTNKISKLDSYLPNYTEGNYEMAVNLTEARTTINRLINKIEELEEDVSDLQGVCSGLMSRTDMKYWEKSTTYLKPNEYKSPLDQIKAAIEDFEDDPTNYRYFGGVKNANGACWMFGAHKLIDKIKAIIEEGSK